VVTAGPTREHLDDVRFLSNASTGRMGIEIARVAARRGATVTLVLGPTAERPPAGVTTVPVVSTRDLLDATRAAAPGADVIVFAAAPSDWRPRERAAGKPPREGGAFALDLVPTEDVAATLGQDKGLRLHVGFALEVGGGPARARAKMDRKRLDAIVLNGPANLGAGGGEVTWLTAAGDAVPLVNRSKARLAGLLVTRVARLAASRRAR
jgi:phosphopantothenoylcysteine decarboxylase/phosphopantothenate--cysteine ligase